MALIFSFMGLKRRYTSRQIVSRRDIEEKSAFIEKEKFLQKVNVVSTETLYHDI